MIKLYVCEISKLIEEVKADSTVLENYFEKLGKERISHILKNSKAEDRARSLGAALLLLFALQRAGLSIEKLPVFEYGKNGKPYFKEFPRIQFNLSHTKHIVTCVISDKEVGVDVEHMRDMHKATIQKVFTDREKQLVNYETEGYIRLWTMKEADAKLSGSGLSQIHEGIEVIETENGKVVRKLNQDIIKTSCTYVVAEGKVLDSMNCPYYYSVCASHREEVHTIHTKWDENNIILCKAI